MDENHLIHLAQQGNIEAFEKLIKKYKNEIFNFAFIKVLDINVAEDLAQEVIIRIFQKINTYNFKGNFSSWLHKVAYTTILKLYKKFTISNVSIYDKEIKDTKEIEDLEKDITNKQLLYKLLQIINKLPEELKDILIMCDIQGKKYEEIAEILDINIGTVKSRLFNARKKLKELCEKENLLEML
ncbi:MAG: RNA polymerase sigma factor [Endomicrobia bacterium]|nr:RNA polymerase sigma factor [Endomicrobiia bacterium]